jgi:hypothetical protein
MSFARREFWSEQGGTHASPSSSESFCRLFVFLALDFFVVGLPEAILSGELSLLMFMGASSSSSEEAPPASARSSSSISDMVNIAPAVSWLERSLIHRTTRCPRLKGVVESVQCRYDVESIAICSNILKNESLWNWQFRGRTAKANNTAIEGERTGEQLNSRN